MLGPSWCDRTFCNDSRLVRDQMHSSEIIEVAGVVRTRDFDPVNG